MHLKQIGVKPLILFQKNAEIIIYDTDSTHTYKRMKIGDGVTKVNLLKFVDDNIRHLISELTNNFESFDETINTTIENLQIKNSQKNYKYLEINHHLLVHGFV